MFIWQMTPIYNCRHQFLLKIVLQSAFNSYKVILPNVLDSFARMPSYSAFRIDFYQSNFIIYLLKSLVLRSQTKGQTGTACC